MPASPLHPDDPRQLGGYTIVGRLGQGGMGSVYLGEDPAGRRVAVKVIRPDLASVPEFRARFRSEIKRARQVPAFCTAEVLDADAEHVTPYLVVEYVDGLSLADVIAERGPLSCGDLHGLAIGTAVALVAIHDAGVVHRDLKPSNVLLPVGTTKVIDFGIARALDASREHTLPGHVVGTLAYMAPERFPGHPEATDGRPAVVFSWAAVVLYAATGRTPLLGESALVTTPRLPDLAVLPHPLRSLVAAALRGDPADRPTAHQLLERLLDADAGGSLAIRAGLRGQPQLRSAASAVRNTVPHPAGPPAHAMGRPAAEPTDRRTVHPDVRPTARPTLRRHAAEDPPTTTASPPSACAGTGPPPSGRAGTGLRRWARRVRISPRRATVVAGLVVLTFLAAFGNRLDGMGLDGTEPTATRSTQAEPRGTAAEERAGRGSGRNGCTLDGPLVVDAAEPTAFRCPAPVNTPSARSITLRLALGTAESCGAVWLHRAGGDAYRIAVCPERISVDAERDADARTLAFTALIPPLPIARPHRIAVTVEGSVLAVAVDGAPALTRPGLPADVTRGAVTVGLVTTGPEPSRTAQATVSDIEVRSTA